VGGAVVKNTARLYSYWATASMPGGYGALGAHNRISPSNYDRTLMQNGWTLSVLEAHIENAGIWYINDHSTPTSHNVNSPLVQAYDWPAAGTPNYLDWRGPANGSGIPPFNSTQNPPVHLAVFHGCDTGDADIFRPVLRPFYNAHSSLPFANQAAFGILHKPLVDEAQLFADRLFEELMRGHTVRRARFKFVERNMDDEDCDEPKLHVYLTEASTNKFLINDVDWIPFVGDEYARVRSVYRAGSHEWTGPEDWWR
jgi:hypothetical protein